jgi:hypothetical protein
MYKSNDYLKVLKTEAIAIVLLLGKTTLNRFKIKEEVEVDDRRRSMDVKSH